MNDRLIPIVVVGARGRMGKTLIRCVMESDNLTLAGAVEASGGPGMGEDIGRLVGMPEAGIRISDEVRVPRGGIVVDFSLPTATDKNIDRCIQLGAPLVLGTTGIGAETRQRLKEAGQQLPIVSAANFSVGITLLTRLAAVASRALGRDWETEIFELHHRHKRDAPSGTALRLGKAVASATDRNFDECAVKARDTTETQRTRDEIGIVALRGGDSVGEHTMLFLGEGERIELTHRAADRAIFALGALRAARWLSGRAPGVYDMADVLGLGSIG